MNKEKIKAAFRQVQEDCRIRKGDCKIESRPNCKHVELCKNTRTTLPKDWSVE